MRPFKKSKKADLNAYYTLFLEVGLIITLLLFLGATKLDIKSSSNEIKISESQDKIVMEEVVKTKQEVKPPSLPKPQVPVAVPNNEIISDEILNIDAEIDFSEALEIPPPPKEEIAEEEGEEEDFFVVVEQMPVLIGGLEELQAKIEYPKKAQKALIEGRVIVQFIITEKGNVENPVVIRGIGGGCDEEALRVVKTAKFEPGMQRGVPVRVQYTVPIHFKLYHASS